MIAEIMWPVAVIISVIAVSWFTYLSSDARKAVDKRRADKAERDAQRAHELAVEREKALVAQTTYLWPTPDAVLREPTDTLEQ
jgi:hypothetical protein